MVFFSIAASRSALWANCAGSSSRPLISMLIGVCGNAFSTSASVGTRKSLRLKPFGGFFAPVRTPRNGYRRAGSPETALRPGTKLYAASSLRTCASVRSVR